MPIKHGFYMEKNMKNCNYIPHSLCGNTEGKNTTQTVLNILNDTTEKSEYISNTKKIGLYTTNLEDHNKKIYNMVINDFKEELTRGLAEGIRCAMCTNVIANEYGCDGGCVVNEDMYKRVMSTINKHIHYGERLIE